MTFDCTPTQNSSKQSYTTRIPPFAKLGFKGPPFPYNQPVSAKSSLLGLCLRAGKTYRPFC